MFELGQVRWVEIFTLLISVFTLGAPLFFLIYFYRRHYLDNLDCSKYEVFTTDPSIGPHEQPPLPVSCEPRFLDNRPWWNSVNTGWFWITLAIAGIYFLITLVGFIASRGFADLRQALPM